MNTGYYAPTTPGVFASCQHEREKDAVHWRETFEHLRVTFLGLMPILPEVKN